MWDTGAETWIATAVLGRSAVPGGIKANKGDKGFHLKGQRETFP